MKRILVLLALALSSCALGGEPPDVPTAPVVTFAPPAPPIEPIRPTPVVTPQWVSLPAPLPVDGDVARGPEPAPKRAEPKNAGKGGKPAPAQSPAQLIEEANRTARLAPSPRGYFGGGGTHRYQWTPGKIYDVYLSPASGTKIMFPPGEVLAHELVLNPDSFDVSSATIGGEVSKSTVLFIRPCAEGEQGCKPVASVDVALVSESGRSYDLHLIVGKVGMVGVTWAIAPIVQMQIEEQPGVGGGVR